RTAPPSACPAPDAQEPRPGEGRPSPGRSAHPRGLTSGGSDTSGSALRGPGTPGPDTSTRSGSRQFWLAKYRLVSATTIGDSSSRPSRLGSAIRPLAMSLNFQTVLSLVVAPTNTTSVNTMRNGTTAARPTR